MEKLLLLVVLLLIQCASNDRDAARTERVPSTTKTPLSILLVAGLFPGHVFTMVSLGEALVRRGHNVTLCANELKGSDLYPGLPERAGVKFLRAGYDPMTQEEFDDLHEIMQSGLFNFSAITSFNNIFASSYHQIRAKVEEIGLENFDIVIADYSIFPMAAYFHEKGIKSVVFSTVMVFPSPLNGVPTWPSPLPNSEQSDDLSFGERLFNFLVHSVLMKPLMSRFFGSVIQIDSHYEAVLSGKDVMEYLGLRIPLIVNAVFGLDFPKDVYPLTSYVGPVLMESHPPIEKELLAWLDSKEDKTVIFISTGATGVLTAENAENLLKGVMATPYHALWVIKKKNRKDSMNLKVFGKRLFVAERVPRQLVLKHRALLMTILHCGLNSVQESLANSLPIICTPLGYDHFEIAAKVFHHGAGVGLYGFMESRDIQPEKVREAIEHVISSDCAANASRIRKMFKLAGGGERAAELVEFYAEVGYEHLVPSFVKYEWSWVQYYNLDVWLLVLCVCGVAGWLSWRIIRCACNTCCR